MTSHSALTCLGAWGITLCLGFALGGCGNVPGAAGTGVGEVPQDGVSTEMVPGGANGMADEVENTDHVDSSNGMSDGGGGTTETSDTEIALQPAVLPRLTQDQYWATLEMVFNQRLRRAILEDDTNPDLFYSIGATSTDLSERGVDLYKESAQEIAAHLLAPENRENTLPMCRGESLTEACLSTFIAETGRLLFRRPLTAGERTQYLTLATDLEGRDLYAGAEYMLAAMLQSPFFLYRVELGEPDPDNPTQNRYTAYEMAQRLSFTLLNRGPHAELLDAAADGLLLDTESLQQYAEVLLTLPESEAAVQAFFSQYLDLKRLHRIELDPDTYPLFSPELLVAMSQEVKLLVKELTFYERGDIRDLFTQKRGYVNRTLAELYGIETDGLAEHTFMPVDFAADVPRAGILTSAAFLTMNAHPTETSPTLRGKYIRERILCQEVPAPPDDIDLNLDAEEGENSTLRQRLEAHREDPQCAGCHAFIDPPGYLFENYDSLGQYREMAEGHPVDASGALDGVELENALGLAEVLKEKDELTRCIVQQLFRHVQGRREVPGERPLFRKLQESLAVSGYDFQSLMVAMILSPSFRFLAPNMEDAP